MFNLRAGTLLAVLIGLTVVASMFLVQTNSLSSILIKESVAVVGSVLIMLIAAFFIIMGRPFFPERISRGMWISLLVLLFWIFLRHVTGIGSVNGPKLIFNLLAIAGIASVIALCLRRPDRDTLLWIVVGGAFLLALYGVVQGLGYRIFDWDPTLISEGRSSGSMGNPNLLGSFAAAMIPVGVIFLASRRRLRVLRWVLAALFALVCTGAVIASKTRGSLIGLFVVMLAAPFIPAVRKKGLVRSLAVLLVVVVLIAGALFFMMDRMRELTDSESREGGTFMVRKLIWSGSLSLIADSPLIGWGPGSFQIKFPEYRDPGYHVLGVSHNTLHAHCEYLEIVVDIGLVGLLLWGSLLIFTTMRVRRGLSGADDADDSDLNEGEAVSELDEASFDWVPAGLVLGIASLLTEASVSVALRWPPSGLLLGILSGLLLASLPKGKIPGARSSRRFIPAIILAATAIFLVVSGIPEYSRSMRAGKELFMSKTVYLREVEGQLMAAIQSAENWAQTSDPQQRSQAIEYLTNARLIADSSVVWAQRCTVTNPNELGAWYALGSAHLTRAMLYRPVSGPLMSILASEGLVTYDSDISNENVLHGMAAYDSLMERAPFYAETHNNLALAWSNLGDPDSSVASIRTAWGLHAHNRESYSRQLTLLAPFCSTPDAIHLLWIQKLDLQYPILEASTDIKREKLIDALLFYSGTVFLSDPQAADSLETALASICDSLTSELSSDICDGMELQLTELASDLELLERFETGDREGMLQEIRESAEEQPVLTPTRDILLGVLLAQEGDIEGVQYLSRANENLVFSCFSTFANWPLGIAPFEELTGLLSDSRLATEKLRKHFLMNAVNLLALDRKLHAIHQMMSVSPTYLERIPVELQHLFEESWRRLGGPLYCFTRSSLLTDSTGAVPLTAPGSISETMVSGLSELIQADSTRSDLLLTELSLYYIFFISFYTDNPSFTQDQALTAIAHLREARRAASEIIGEDQLRYTLGTYLLECGLFREEAVSLEYRGLIESLRSDIIMGNLPE